MRQVERAIGNTLQIGPMELWVIVDERDHGLYRQSSSTIAK
jgi:hypothetical protein